MARRIDQRPVRPMKQDDSHAAAYENMENFMAKVKGQQAYYKGSPSSPEIKRAVAKKMGAR